jgi:outer membrane receptor protein involved in Fe transport
MNAAEALNRLADQTGAIMLFPYDLASARQANAVRGHYTLLEGLELLLQDTGLSGGLSDKRVVNIAPLRDEQRKGGDMAREKKKGILAGVAAAVLSVFGQNAAGQGNVADQTGRGGTIEEIVVTAQKREESLQDVALSMTALGKTDINRRGLVSAGDYLRTIPSVSMMDNGPGQDTIIVRGAYGEAFSTGPTVGIYFGDVPLTGYAIGGSADIKLIDIDRVEVLRGPQGTLYGSNSLSGTLRYIPAEPDLQALTGDIKVGYSQTGGSGGDNTLIEGVVNIPVVEDRFALRAMAYRHHNDGYVRNIAGDDPELQADAALFGAESLAVNQDHIGSSTYTGGRLSALWRPTETFEFSLTYLTQDVAQDERPFEQTQFGKFQRSTYKFGETVGNEDSLKTDVDILNVSAEYDLGWGTVFSSTSWIEQSYVRKWEIGSFFGSPHMPIPQISTTNAEVFVEELRLTSELDGPMQFQAGLYYEDSEMPTSQPTFFGGDPALNPFGSGVVQLWDLFLDRLVTQKAAFGELSYDLTDELKVALGGRSFKYDARFISRTFDSFVVAETASDDEAGESGNTFKARVEYAPGEDALVYVSWSEGFRLGRPLSTDLIGQACDTDGDGFLDGTDIPAFLDRVSSDSLESYEIGAKVTLMEGRATINTAAYHNEWTNIPVSVRPPGCIANTVVNGGEARARGIEIEGGLAVAGNWHVSFGIGYVDTELTATTSAGNAGDRMNFTPELNSNLGVEYNFNLGENPAFVRTDYAYFGDYYTATGEQGQFANSYSLVNLSAGARFGRAELQLQVQNVLNSDAFTVVDGPASFPPGYAIRLRPRTVGVNVSYGFR